MFLISSEQRDPLIGTPSPAKGTINFSETLPAGKYKLQFFTMKNTIPNLPAVEILRFWNDNTSSGGDGGNLDLTLPVGSYDGFLLQQIINDFANANTILLSVEFRPEDFTFDVVITGNTTLEFVTPNSIASSQLLGFGDFQTTPTTISGTRVNHIAEPFIFLSMKYWTSVCSDVHVGTRAPVIFITSPASWQSMIRYTEDLEIVIEQDAKFVDYEFRGRNGLLTLLDDWYLLIQAI